MAVAVRSCWGAFAPSQRLDSGGDQRAGSWRQAALHPCPQRILGFLPNPHKVYFGACVSRAAGGRPLPRSR